jgi:glutathione peroxidase
MATIYDFKVKKIGGDEQNLADFQGKALLIVNTASKCGFTPQYTELQELYTTWHEQGLEILAFPCDQFGHQEPGSDAEIQQFCQLNYGLTFPVYAKIDVNGDKADPIYQYLREQKKSWLGGSIKWNFTKFLVDRSGKVVKRYEPAVKPGSIAPAIQKILGKDGND